MQSTKLALIPVVAIMASILITLALGFSAEFLFNPPNVAFALNAVFWSIATFSIAFISARSFLKEGSAIVFIISISIIIFGASQIIAGWANNFSGNYAVAISNTCILVAALLQVLSSVLAFSGRSETKIANRKAVLTIAFVAAVIFVAANSVAILSGYYPVFYTSSGPTLLRQVILGSGIISFAIASIIFIAQYFRSKSLSVYLYALAIGLFAIGLSSSLQIKALGDVLTWLGRIGLYIGAIYLLAAILSTKKKAEGIDRASAWAGAFKANPEQFEALFSNMLDAFLYGKIIVDSEGNPVDWVFLDVNDSYGKVTGLKREQVIGKKVSELYPDEQKDPSDWIGKYGRVALTGEPTHFEGYRLSLKKWLHVSSYSPRKGYFIVIFEDITDRKKAEEALILVRSGLLKHLT